MNLIFEKETFWHTLHQSCFKSKSRWTIVLLLFQSVSSSLSQLKSGGWFSYVYTLICVSFKVFSFREHRFQHLTKYSVRNPAGLRKEYNIFSHTIAGLKQIKKKYLTHIPNHMGEKKQTEIKKCEQQCARPLLVCCFPRIFFQTTKWVSACMFFLIGTLCWSID